MLFIKVVSLAKLENMKKLILLAGLTGLFFSCTEERTAKEILMDGPWTAESVTFNGIEMVDSLLTNATMVFTEDLVISDADQQEPDTASYSLQNNDTELLVESGLNSIRFQIEGLSQNSVRLNSLESDDTLNYHLVR